MAQFLVAIGLVLVIEGLLFAAFPAAAKRLAATALESPENSLRVAGILSAVLGLVLIWLVGGGQERYEASPVCYTWSWARSRFPPQSRRQFFSPEIGLAS